MKTSLANIYQICFVLVYAGILDDNAYNEEWMSCIYTENDTQRNIESGSTRERERERKRKESKYLMIKISALFLLHTYVQRNYLALDSYMRQK